MNPETTSPILHRALAHPARGRLVDVLRAVGGCGIDELAERAGLHANTVRGHLALLEEAGLVTSEPEPRDRPGRPRIVYRATERASAVDRDGYRLLAQVLSSYIAATAGDAAAAGREAGIAWGRHLVEAPDHSVTTDSPAALAEVMALLDGFGFAPELEHRTTDHPVVHLHRCPFVEVARDEPDVVCAMHLGLLQGALAELNADVEATELLPFVEPDRCAAHLRVRT